MVIMIIVIEKMSFLLKSVSELNVMPNASIVNVETSTKMFNVTVGVNSTVEEMHTSATDGLSFSDVVATLAKYLNVSVGENRKKEKHTCYFLTSFLNCKLGSLCFKTAIAKI